MLHQLAPASRTHRLVLLGPLVLFTACLAAPAVPAPAVTAENASTVIILNRSDTTLRLNALQRIARSPGKQFIVDWALFDGQGWKAPTSVTGPLQCTYDVIAAGTVHLEYEIRWREVDLLQTRWGVVGSSRDTLPLSLQNGDLVVVGVRSALAGANRVRTDVDTTRYTGQRADSIRAQLPVPGSCLRLSARRGTRA